MSRICPCPDPPGGHIVCEDHQFGMCGYRDGKKVGGCLNIPGIPAMAQVAPEVRQYIRTNGVLSELTGIKRNMYAPITLDEFAILRSGEFRTAEGEVIRFSLPSDLDLKKVQTYGESRSRSGTS